MYPGALVTLNMRELDRLKVIQTVVDMGLKPGRAAERLGLPCGRSSVWWIVTASLARLDWPRAAVAVQGTGGWTGILGVTRFRGRLCS